MDVFARCDTGGFSRRKFIRHQDIRTNVVDRCPTGYGNSWTIGAESRLWSIQPRRCSVSCPVRKCCGEQGRDSCWICWQRVGDDVGCRWCFGGSHNTCFCTVTEKRFYYFCRSANSRFRGCDRAICTRDNRLCSWRSWRRNFHCACRCSVRFHGSIWCRKRAAFAPDTAAASLCGFCKERRKKSNRNHVCSTLQNVSRCKISAKILQNNTSLWSQAASFTKKNWSGRVSSGWSAVCHTFFVSHSNTALNAKFKTKPLQNIF